MTKTDKSYYDRLRQLSRLGKAALQQGKHDEALMYANEMVDTQLEQGAFDVVGDVVAMVAREQHEAAQRGVLSMWKIHDRPHDWPHGYVARRFDVGKDNAPIPTCDEIKGSGDPAMLLMLRYVMGQAGLACLTRKQEDHPNVVETWV